MAGSPTATAATQLGSDAEDNHTQNAMNGSAKNCEHNCDDNSNRVLLARARLDTKLHQQDPEAPLTRSNPGTTASTTAQ